MQGIGLLALLVVLAIILVLFAQHTSQVASVNKEVRPQVEQIAGVDESGKPVTHTYTLQAVNENGHLKGLKVVQLAPSSPMRKFYGLQEGDIITEASPQGGVMMSVKDNDASTMRDYVAAGYQAKQPLLVLRDGKQLTLPQTNAEKNAAKKPSDADGVQSQLDAIQNAGGR
jgi:hypothetical protein